MKNIVWILLAGWMLSACGNNSGDSASGGGTSEASSASQLTFDTSIKKSVEAGRETVTVTYVLKDSNGMDVGGVIQFGDGEQASISGTGMITHIYQRRGRYALSVEFNDGNSFAIGDVEIQSDASSTQGLSNCVPDVEQVSGTCVVS